MFLHARGRRPYQFARPPFTGREIILFTAPFYGDKLSPPPPYSSARPPAFLLYMYNRSRVLCTHVQRGLESVYKHDQLLLPPLLDNDVKCFPLPLSPPDLSLPPPRSFSPRPFTLSGHYYPRYYYYYRCVCLCVKLRMRSVFPRAAADGPHTLFPLPYRPARGPHSHFIISLSPPSRGTLFAKFIPVTKRIIITLIQFVAISPAPGREDRANRRRRRV